MTKTAKTEKILIGGAALRRHGSDRHTDDVDYLVWIKDAPVFIHKAEGDLVNAAAHNFLAEVWESCNPSEGVADPQSMLELKAWAFVNYCQNGDFRHADKAEYDIKFLVRHFDVTKTPILAKVAHAGELAEVAKIIAGVRR